MPRLSILIPAFAGAEPLERTLVSVLQNRPAHCEVMVVHSGWYEDPYQLTDEVRFFTADAQGLALINAAIAAASGDIIHLLGCGLEVDEGWTDPVLAHFDDRQVWAVSPLRVNSEQRIVSAGIKFTSGGARGVVAGGPRGQVSPNRLLGCPQQQRGQRGCRVLGPSIWSAFLRRQTVLRFGGFDEKLGFEWADIDLALRLAATNQRCIVEPRCKIQGMDPPPPEKRRAFSVGRSAERLFWRHGSMLGSPSDPASVWRRSRIRHSGRVFGELVWGLLFWPPSLLKVCGRMSVILAQCWMGPRDSTIPVSEENEIATRPILQRGPNDTPEAISTSPAASENRTLPSPNAFSAGR